MDLCGGPFWDWDLTWVNTTSPDFTPCFQDTVVIGIPCVTFLVLSSIELILKSQRNSRLLWTAMLIAKLGICVALLAMHVCDFWEVTHRPHGYFAAQLWSPVIQFFTTVGVTALIVYYQRRGVITALSLFFFWLLYTLSTGIRYRSLLLGVFSDVGEHLPYAAPSRLRFVLTTSTFWLSAAQFILICFADRRMSVKKDCFTRSPENDASVLCLSWFWWLNSFIALGYKRVRQGSGLRMEDLWELDDENKTKGILETFSPIYAAELENNKSQFSDQVSDENAALENRANILYPLLRTFSWDLFAAGFIKLIASLVVFVPPIILNLLINFVKSDEPLWQGVFLASLMLVSNMTGSLLNNQYEYRIHLIGMRVRSALTYAIYCKALKLSTHAKSKFTTGEIVTLMSVDSQRFMDQVNYMMLIWSVPLQIAIALYMLWQQLGVASLAAISVPIVLMPLNAYVARFFQKNQVKLMEMKDQRTKLMSEILNGIKILKLYAWENSFLERITKFRSKELEALRIEAWISGLLVFTYTCAPFLVAFASFATYVLIDSNNVLDANVAFVSLSLFNILNLPMAYIPFLVTFTAMFLVSLNRVNKYLRCEELDEDAVERIRGSSIAISVKNASFQYGKSDYKPVLEGINLEVKRGQLVAVVGTVGAGKSTLLNALLGGIIKKSGTVTVSGSVAYVPQQAWIQGTTIKNNILFGSEYSRGRYEETLNACALRADLAVLPGGDETEVGEKGINLSGGQKQRISLARALYADSDIYYFDDPLSAVDPNVSKHIFDEVISNKGALASKTRILVTHRLSVLDQCDLVYVLKDGKISEQGSYQELVARKGAFAEFLMQYLQEKSQIDENHADDSNITDETPSPAVISQIPMINGTGSDTPSELGKPRRRGTGTRTISVASSACGRTSEISRLDSREHENEVTPGAVLAKEEEAAVGSVEWKVYKDYLMAMGTVGSGLFIVAFAAASGFNIATQLWLSAWSEDSYEPSLRSNTAQRDYRLGVYAAWGASEILATLVAAISLDLTTIRGGRVLHEKMLSRVMRAPMSFFDTTPMGRILNRFSKDIDTTDSILRHNLRLLIPQSFRTFSALLLIGLQTPIFLILIVPLGILYNIIQKLYVATSRHLKRLESTSRSPVYVHFSETLSGCSTIRAYGVEERFIEMSNLRTDINHSAYYPSVAATRWLSIHLELLGYTIVFLAALLAALARETLSPGYAGLSITAALTITQTLNELVRATSDAETNFVSVERCLEYSGIDMEADWVVEDNRPEPDWPVDGAIEFNNYSTRYREGLPLVVKNISFEIHAGEKVGVVGRTGAGKSSLTLALFRLIEATQGNIAIDSLDVSQIGLHDLRSKLTIIPQEPVLFSGTIRENLDPFGEKGDEALWTALEHAHLKGCVESLESGLSHEVTEGGENMSVGQRQLVCLARALLRKTKILILDEATAAVDMETDDLIQETLRKEFVDSTTLTIAHRLNTIINYDRILVLSEGRVAEYDTPKALLSDTNSLFYAMAKDAGLV